MHIHFATLATNTGYGRFSAAFVEELVKQQRKFTLSSNSVVPDPFKPFEKRAERADLVIGLPHDRFPGNVHFTMYESTELPKDYVANLLQRKKVIVPCSQNAFVFGKYGIKTSVIPLCVNAHYVNPSPFVPFTFLHVANDSGIPDRKQSMAVIEAFKAAFTGNENVRLVVKKAKEDVRIPCYDTRILCIYDTLSDVDMAKLYDDAHVGVFAGGQEGWGYPHTELMAKGRPIIAPRYGGPEMFMTANNSYSLNFKLVRTPQMYFKGIGKCPKINQSHLAFRMQYAFLNSDDVVLKGVLAYRTILGFSPDRMTNSILNEL